MELISQYVRELVEMHRAWHADQEAELVRLEAEGYRLVELDGCASWDDRRWKVLDYRTGALIASGHDDAALTEYEETEWERLRLCHTDAVYRNVDIPDGPDTPEGMPNSLATALSMWVDEAAEDAAAWLANNTVSA
jgi:hypothetical protein